MKTLILSVLILASSFRPVSSFAQEHVHHPKHNMVLFGENEAFYASHIVYKVPHNFQVILRLNLSYVAREMIAREMRAHPAERFIFLLNHMDISQIQAKPTISGEVFRTTAEGVKVPILPNLEVSPENYEIVYFDELPLSLGDDSPKI